MVYYDRIVVSEGINVMYQKSILLFTIGIF